MTINRWGVIALVFVAGCAGAEWQKVSVAPAYQVPKQLKVSLVAEASTDTTPAALAAMQSALAERLASKGITATFVSAPSGQPQADLTIAEWDPGSRALRWLVGFGAGKGSVVVVVKSPSADGRPGVEGIVNGWVKGGFFGGTSEIAATQAGQLIAEAIATGKTD